jgi:hypothetical protein
MSAYIKRTKIFQINNLLLHHRLLEKQEQTKSKTSRREIIKRAEINEIETKKTHKVLMIQEACSLKK